MVGYVVEEWLGVGASSPLYFYALLCLAQCDGLAHLAIELHDVYGVYAVSEKLVGYAQEVAQRGVAYRPTYIYGYE